MRRREFLSVLSSAVSWPIVVRAQSPKLPTIGFLGTDATNWTNWTAAFVARMRELGWIEGSTIAITYRWSEGRAERVVEVATEFVRLKVDVIVSYGTAIPSLMQATSTIPIVFAIAIDPVGAGLVASLGRPGGNVTGVSSQQTDVAGKRLDLLHEVVPDLRHLVIMADVANPQAALEMGEVQAAARRQGLEITPFAIRRAEDIATGFAAIKSKASALYVVQDALVVANRTQIITFALSKGLPMIITSRDFVQAGALLSYGPSYPALFRRAAEYVDRILRGTKPGDLPVEQPTKFDLVINLTTAKALGLTMPPPLLARADEVIE
jgi:putative tryptophan/tyrosine transport system substrate-binding protein